MPHPKKDNVQITLQIPRKLRDDLNFLFSDETGKPKWGERSKWITRVLREGLDDLIKEKAAQSPLQNADKGYF